MAALRFEKASDVEYDYCFLEIFLGEQNVPFMDVRISESEEASFCIYSKHYEANLTFEQWQEIYREAEKFVKEEIENERAARGG